AGNEEAEELTERSRSPRASLVLAERRWHAATGGDPMRHHIRNRLATLAFISVAALAATSVRAENWTPIYGKPSGQLDFCYDADAVRDAGEGLTEFTLKGCGTAKPVFGREIVTRYRVRCDADLTANIDLLSQQPNGEWEKGLAASDAPA